MARILIIEDNPTNLQLMAYLLGAFGHATVDAADGEAGLARAAEMPDLILCDVQIPKIDGFEVARWLKSHPVLRAIPLVAVTALAMVGDRDRALTAGFDGYIAKPIEPETFVRQVEAYLRNEPPVSERTSARETPGPEAPGNFPAQAQGRSTVLVVDNQPVNLHLARSILEPFGYTVLVADGAQSGLATAREHRCDLILSDICMGEQSGYDFLVTVLEDPGLRSVPFIFITSTMVEQRDRDRALALGAARFLVRPIEPDKLLAELAACLKERTR